MALSLLAAPLLALAPQAAPATPAVPAVEVPPLLERVAVVGASVSDGFGLKKELGVDVDLASFLAAALPAESELLAAGSSHVFLDPLPRSDALLERALEFEPTLVVAVDFLFWFGYGFFGREESRLALFERGLERLERFECDVLVGTIPDMSGALEGTSIFGPMLRPAQIPEPATLVALNTRLAEWAAERERVHVVPLAAFTHSLLEGDIVEIRDNRWEGTNGAPMLQRDLLHPTLRGMGAVTLLILDSLARSRPELQLEVIVWNEGRLEERLRELLADELAEAERRRIEREERRERRLRRLEERKGN